jgi:hypothetical protein
VNTYQDPIGRFNFRFPSDWHQFDIEGREGVIYRPLLQDEQTLLSAWVSKLDVAVVAEDLDELRKGVAEGLARLEQSIVEAESEVVLGNLIKFERVYTYREGDATRKRKVWIIYVDVWLIVLTWQGSSEEEYDYWFAMANYTYHTFTIPEALWYATDRDLVGHSRQ